MTTRTIDEPWSWSITFATFLTNLLVIGFLKSFTLLVSDLREYFQTSTSTIMLAGGLVLSLTALVSPIASYLCDRYTTRYTTLWASVAASVSFVMSSFSKNPVYLVLLFGIVGVCFSMCYIPTLSMLPRCHRKRRVLSSGIAMSGASAGLILMAPMILILLRHYHITQTLFILGAVFLNLIVSGILMPEIILDPDTRQPIFTEGKYRVKPSKLHKVSGGKYFSFIEGRYVLYVLAACMANTGYTGQYTIHAGFSEEHDVTEFYIGLGLVIQGVIDIFGRVLAGWIGDLKLIPHWIYLVISLIAMSTNAMFSALFAVYQPGFVIWVIYSCVLVISGSFYQIYVFIEASNLIGVKKFGEAYSFNMMFLGITNTPMQYLLGYLKDLTGRYIWSMVLCSFLSGISGLVFLIYHIVPKLNDATNKKSFEIKDTELNLLSDKEIAQHINDNSL